METYSRTGNNYSVDTYKEFVLLSRSGLSKSLFKSEKKHVWENLTLILFIHKGNEPDCLATLFIVRYHFILIMYLICF